MLIEFRCSNHSGYDAATGRYVPCDHVIVVSDDQIGTLVECEKCHQMVEVPFDYGASTRRRKKSAKPKQAARVQGKTTTANRPVEKIDPVKRDVMSMDFESEKPIQHGPVHRSDRKRCPKCGALLADNGHCTLCHYVEKRYDVQGIPLAQIKVKPAGFQLWIAEIVSDGVSIKLLSYFMIAMISLLFLIIASACVVTGGFGGFASLFLVTLGYVVFLLTIVKTRQLATNPVARLGFLTPFWNILLVAARAMNWQGYDARFKGRKIVDLRNAPLTDDQLPNVEGLRTCQVLDIENSMVTDRGLRHLYSLTDLRCLVLRKTKVTHDGVIRLQQAHPRIWIWY